MIEEKDINGNLRLVVDMVMQTLTFQKDGVTITLNQQEIDAVQKWTTKIANKAQAEALDELNGKNGTEL